MIKSPYFAAIGALAVAAAAAAVPFAALAQSAQATMPAFYNVQGMEVNNGNTGPLPAGTYYLAPGGQNPITYYGNGMYYDASLGEYGGSVVNDPNGTAGVNLGYSSSVLSETVPSVPNTGAGGDSLPVWATLIVSGAVVLAGLAYIGFYSSRRMSLGL